METLRTWRQPQATCGSQPLGLKTLGSDLECLALEATRAVDWTQPGVDGRVGRQRTRRTEIMLFLLTHAYAQEIFGSREIIDSIYSERIGAGVIEDAGVDIRSLMHFRRNNRDLIEQCVAQALLSVGANHPHETTFGTAPESGVRFAEGRLIAGLVFEASRRVDRAVEWDSMAGDG